MIRVVPTAATTEGGAAGSTSGSRHTATPSTAMAPIDASFHGHGHVNHARVYHRARARASTACMTRGSSVCGERGSGSCRSWPSTIRASSSSLSRSIVRHQPPQCLARAVNVRLDLRERHAERPRDLVVAELFEMEEDERNALRVRQTVNRLLEPHTAIGVLVFDCPRHARFEPVLVSFTT